MKALLTALLLLPAPAFADTGLIATYPANGARVKPADALYLNLSFRYVQVPEASGAMLSDSAGKTIAVAIVSAAKILLLPPELTPGAYMVSWHSKSRDDGRAGSGRFTFTVIP